MTQKTEQSASNSQSSSKSANNNEQVLQTLHKKFSTDIWPEVKIKVIDAAESGISEFDLLKFIASNHSSTSVFINFANPHALFPIHFLLFHHLYLWQRQLVLTESLKTLIISPMSIQLLDKQIGHQVGELDRLGAYYSDLENLYSTSNEELDAMLTKFWRKFCAFDEMSAAFDTLGLAPTKDIKIIKKHYQKQMTTHHPDKGGCPKRAQDIINAYHTLKKAVD